MKTSFSSGIHHKCQLRNEKPSLVPLWDQRVYASKNSFLLNNSGHMNRPPVKTLQCRPIQLVGSPTSFLKCINVRLWYLATHCPQTSIMKVKNSWTEEVVAECVLELKGWEGAALSPGELTAIYHLNHRRGRKGLISLFPPIFHDGTY